MKEYKNKTILLTGASTGIGYAMAHLLADQGANLIITARGRDKLEDLAKELKDKNIQIQIFTQDISEANSAKNLFNQIEQANLSVDLLINNAGYGRWGEFTEIDMEDYENMIQLNVTSLTELSYLYAKKMAENGAGGIINIASTAALYPIPYSAVYAATKAYVLSLSEALNFEYSRKGIKVMAVCPGATESKFVERATENSVRLKQRMSRFKDIENSTVRIQSAEECAKEALDAFLKGKIYVVTGRSNRMLYTLSRFFTRKVMLTWAGKAFKKIAG
tara:strand:- start:45 stop:872 length:828 start_codon:yes stop_codon:yes gene_type:complete